MAVQWGLGQGNNALANFQFGVQLGQNFQDRRDEREYRNALLDQRRAEQEAQQQQREEQRVQQQQQQRRADLPMLGRLLDFSQDEGTYQQARATAQEYGIDISGIPETFGDGAWVAQQRQVVRLMQTPEGQEALSTAGKQAQDAGYRPGTPEFTSAVRQIITADLAQPYMGAGGETRLYTPNVFGGAQQQAQSAEIPQAAIEALRRGEGTPEQFDQLFGPGASQRVMTPAPEVGANGQPTTITRAQYQAIVATKGQAATDAWAQRNNIRIEGR